MKRLVIALGLLVIVGFSGQLLPFEGLLRHIEFTPPGCSLGERITAANRGRTVSDCTRGDTPGTIFLHSNVKLRSALPPITSHITIFGNGHWISGDDRFRIFLVKGGNLTLIDVALRNGKAWRGGAIKQLANADVHLANVSIMDSRASVGGAIYNQGGRLIIDRSSFKNNRASSIGGVIFNDGELVVRQSSFHHNSSNHSAGGIDSRGTLDISNSTISNNQARRLGGGLHVRGNNIAQFTHVTVTENLAPRGGGIYSSNDELVLINSLIVANHSSAYCGHDNVLTVKSIASYINDSCGKRRATRPWWLRSLNHAPAFHALAYASEDLPAADRNYCPKTDQRGAERTPGFGCDIGAYEFTGNN